MAPGHWTYSQAGVNIDHEEGGLGTLRQWVEKTFDLRKGLGTVKLPLGFYANVIDIGNNLGIAISTDGVGTKILIAQRLGRLDTIGIDCVAMNANDIICVGAEPLAMVDYIAVESSDPDILGALAKGLYEGARRANISIPGGEVAQVREMIRGEKDASGFDLVGTCIGTVAVDRIITGRDLAEGDVLIGLRSSGVHSNGLTLARRIFFDHLRWSVDRHVPDLGRTLGEELLEPTRIYVPEVVEMLAQGLPIKGLAHITGDGFLNLTRMDAPVSYVLDELPDPLPIFELIQWEGQVEIEEMCRVYNMGIGFAVMVEASAADQVHAICRKHQVESFTIGHVAGDGLAEVRIPRWNLVGKSGRFVRAT